MIKQRKTMDNGTGYEGPIKYPVYSKIQSNSMTYEDTISRSIFTKTVITYVALFNELNGLPYNILYTLYIT